MLGKTVGHVRIESVLGEGGMGEVYLGWDEWLERKVAVKTLRTDTADGANSVARLRREARLLSRLDHPHVCRIYDLVDYQGLDLLFLEFIEGETLVETVKKDLTLDDKLRIGEEIACALAAAHRQQIIHRDLKPENVMITTDGAVKVLDFGIALPAEMGGKPRSEGPSDPSVVRAESHQLKTVSFRPGASAKEGNAGPSASNSRSGIFETDEGAIVGTIAYMSPEQAKGGEVTKASDLFSFGLLLQELLTGEPAYRLGETPAETLVRVAGGEPKRPHNVDPEIAALLGDLLCLDADDRPTAQEAARRLSALRMRPERLRRARRLRLAALFGLVILIATIFVTWRLVAPRPLLEPGETARIAVLPFVNATSDEKNDWVEVGLSEIVGEMLDSADDIRVFPSDRLREKLDRQSIDLERPMTSEQVERLARDLGVFAIINTRLESLEGGSLLVSTIRTRDGTTEEIRVKTRRPLDGADRLAAALAGRFDPDSPIPEIEDSFSFDIFANQAFAIGRQVLETSGAKSALPFFEVCLARDPDFLQADMWRAMAWFRQGRWDEVESELERIAAKADRLGDRKTHAQALVAAATVALERGELERSEKRLEEALSIQQAEGDQEIRAITLTRLAWIQYRRGNLDGAEHAVDESLQLVERLGLREQLPSTLTPWAYIALRRGNVDHAEERFRKAYDVAVEIGNPELAAGANLNLGNLLLQKGALDEALDQVDRARTTFTELGVSKGILVAEINQGAILGELGRWEEALELSRSAATRAEQVGDGRSQVFSLAAVSYFSTRLGRLDEAATELRRARNAEWDRGDVTIAWQIAIDRAYLAIRQGRLDEAASRLREAELSNEDPLNLRIAARLAYARDRYQEAFELDRRNRDAEPAALWTPLREAVSEVYQKSAKESRSYPLPDELPIVSGS